MKMYTIQRRRWIEVNTDPQRRCYHGCHFSSEWRWTEWDVLDSEVPENKLERRLEFWRDLNAYAVSQRGEGAKYEFRAVEEAAA
jgi:hypothetical protein